MRNLLTVILLFSSLNIKAQVWRIIPDDQFAIALANVLPPSAIIGNQLDISSPDVLALETLNLNSDGIVNLTGIDFFPGLKYLDVSANQITIWDTLPPLLLLLNVRSNQITALPNLPSGLNTLRCTWNQITSLPSLPPSLRILECAVNLLTSIPVLPDSLMWLDCADNQLTSMPFIPDSVQYLDFSYNQIADLPQNALHEGLIELKFSDNLISDLPTLPSTLEKLYCDHNFLASLPSLPSSLTYLSCWSNQLTCLPDLPDSLTLLSCSRNQISALPLLPLTLRQLYCHENNISNFPAFPASIQGNYYVPQTQNFIYNFIISDNPFLCIPSMGGLAYNDPQFPQGLPPICSSGNPNDFAEDCSTISVGSNSHEDMVKIYPNPVNTEFVIEIGGELKSLHIFDLNGRLISEFEIKDDKIINVQNLASGVYIMEMFLLDRIVRKKLVIEK